MRPITGEPPNRVARTVRGLRAAGFIVAALVGCSDGSGPSRSVSRVEVNLASPTILVGTNAAVTARAFDLSGEELAEFKVTWKSSATGVVTVSPQGILTAHSLGAATITATVSGVSGSAVLTVVPLPVASVSISPGGGNVDRGQTLQLSATVRDQFGDILTDRAVVWTSSAAGVAPVTSSGLVTGLAAGTSTITASVEGQAAVVTVNVIVTPVPTGPNITSVSPGLLVPGTVATITGTNFGATAGQNEVRVAGVLATIQAASPTELTVQLGSTGYGCEPTRNVFVQVARGGDADARAHPLQALPTRALAPGESIVFTSAADARCFELEATGGRYAISVYNAGTTTADDAGFRLRGLQGLAPPAAIAAASAVHSATTVPAAPRQLAAGAPELRALLSRARTAEAEAVHARILDANLEALARLVPAGGATAAQGSAQGAGAESVALATVSTQPVGSVVSMKIPDVGAFLTTGADFCVQHFTINARVAYNGTRAVLLEDTTAPFAGLMDTVYQKVGEEFDAVVYDLVRTNFADPLLMDDLLDKNGKILMLFSPRINAFAGVAGFVVTCDFEVAAPKASSNRGEVFYAVVPTNTSADPGVSASIPGWYRTIRSTIVHETKHIAAFANRIRDFGGSIEESWLEEGTARIVEEIWARNSAYNGLQQGSNATYANTLFCDVRPSSAQQCVGKPYAMVRHFEQNGLFDFLREPDQRTPLGPRVGGGEQSWYGSAWALARWVADHHAASEAVFFNALVRTSQRGVTNLTARAGRTWEELLGEWSLALYTDDRPAFTPANPRLQFPSWNLRSIYAGLNSDFGHIFNPAFPLVPRAQNYGDFTQTVLRVTRGGFALFELSGAQVGRQFVQLQGLTTPEPGARLRVAVVRLQ